MSWTNAYINYIFTTVPHKTGRTVLPASQTQQGYWTLLNYVDYVETTTNYDCIMIKKHWTFEFNSEYRFLVI